MSVARALVVAVVSLWAGGAWPAAAQTAYPTKTIRIIVPFGAGGPTDVVARLVAEKVSVAWGQQAIVENMAGAGGNTGTAVAAKSAPDGHTVLVVSTGFIINPSLYAKVPYDLKTTFSPISLFAVSPNVISAHPSFPAGTLKEMIAHVKANPAKYSYAQPSTGSTPHLTGELFKLQHGLDLATVTFNNASMAITTTMGGHTPLAFTALPPAMPGIQAGKLKGLAVLSPKRIPGLPDVPTAAEAGFPELESNTLTGFLAPAGTPQDVIDRWSAEIKRIIALPEVAQNLVNMGFQPVGSTPAEFAARIESESARWTKVIQDARIKVE